MRINRPGLADHSRFKTDGGTAAQLSDGVRRLAKLLRVELPEAPEALRS
jgi:hypothetical protein